MTNENAKTSGMRISWRTLQLLAQAGDNEAQRVLGHLAWGAHQAWAMSGKLVAR